MMRVLMLVTLTSLVPVQWSAAEAPRGARGGEAEMVEALTTLGAIVDAALRPSSRTEDAPRLLAEALKSGTADTASMAAILRWVLEAKEEAVAAGFADALRTIDATAGRPENERWSAGARSVIAVFAGLMRDAQVHRRRDGQSVLDDLAPAANALAPAVIEALREADPAARASLLRAVRILAPSAGDVVPPLAAALRHADPAVRLAAANALGALGPAARAAAPDLTLAESDADAAVRDAAAQALRQIQPD
jgi:HEAT repeat protein